MNIHIFMYQEYRHTEVRTEKDSPPLFKRETWWVAILTQVRIENSIKDTLESQILTELTANVAERLLQIWRKNNAGS